MKRREAIRSSAFLVGCGLSMGTIATLTTGCEAAEPIEERPSYLSKDMLNLLGEMVETIIPTTDTPGARDAGAHIFISEAALSFTPEEQGLLTSIMQNLKEADFENKESSEREELLLGLDTSDSDIKPYSLLRDLTCHAYFTSEIGATQALAHLPIPGEYNPCLPLSEVGKAWAL